MTYYGIYFFYNLYLIYIPCLEKIELTKGLFLKYSYVAPIEDYAIHD